MSEVKRSWYVLRAISGKEAKVKEVLDAAIRNTDLGKHVFQVLIPTEKVLTVRNGKKTVKERTLYSGYVFVECMLTGEVLVTLRDTTNVIDFLRGKGKDAKPESLRESEVKRMLGMADELSQGEVDGTNDFLVGEAVKGVADKIKSFLGFSEPEDGPLSNFHTYMPDMMNLMAQGIRKGKSVVGNAIKALTGDMSDDVNDVDLDPDPDPNGGKPKPRGGIGGFRDVLGTVVGGMDALAKSARPSVSTVNGATNNSSVSKNVTQNVEINQEFHGDAAAQKNISKAADSAAEDTTGALARALAYAG